MTPQPPTPTTKHADGGRAAAAGRVVGYDVARAAAMLGMIVVHFTLVAADEGRPGPRWLSAVVGLLDGRAAATFVVLAGVGVTLMSKRAVESGDPSALAAVRWTLARRGVFLLCLGFLNLVIWPGDILRVYGVSLLFVPVLLRARGRSLLVAAAAFALAFALLVLALDFERNWDWATMTYHGLWTPAGMLRNLFFDGFRSVLPWTGFLLYGMWLGRLDLTDRRMNARVLVAAGVAVIVAEAASRVLVRYCLAHPRAGLDAETVHALFGTQSMPALPLFLLAAGGAATFVIALCARLARDGGAWRPLAATGRLALTWYAAHLVVGLGALVALDRVQTESLPVAAGLGLAFFAATVPFSWAWRSRFRHGPLEWLMRVTAG